MQAQDIRAEMVRKKITVTQVAKEVGVSIPLVSLVISGRTPNQRVRECIAHKVNIPVATLWPDNGQ